MRASVEKAQGGEPPWPTGAAGTSMSAPDNEDVAGPVNGLGVHRLSLWNLENVPQNQTRFIAMVIQSRESGGRMAVMLAPATG